MIGFGPWNNLLIFQISKKLALLYKGDYLLFFIADLCLETMLKNLGQK
ncbi:MAG: hypothetical protein ACTSR7_17285 [Promethearchaeota archaeon]